MPNWCECVLRVDGNSNRLLEFKNKVKTISLDNEDSEVINKRYNKGARIERELVKRYKKEGSPFAVRTAGSHSVFDVIAFKGNELHLIQSKTKKEKLDIPKLPS